MGFNFTFNFNGRDNDGHGSNMADQIHAADAKAAAVDADEFGLADSEDSFNLKKFTWAALKAWLGEIFSRIGMDPMIAVYQGLGSSIVAQNFPVNLCSSGTFLTNRALVIQAIYIPKALTITGVCWGQTTQGNYTGNNYNGVGLYSYAAGVLTLVASSTNDSEMWKAASGSLGKKAFTTPYGAQPGVYFIGLLWSNASASTPPSILRTAGVAPWSILDFTNSAKWNAFLSAQTALPSPLNASALSASAATWWCGLY